MKTMKKVIKPVYYCEHCKRHMLSASSMSVHERFCKKAPNNTHKCFDWCVNLQRGRKINHGNFNIEVDFVCAVSGLSMYSFKLERRIQLGDRREIGDMVRMPLECKDFQRMTDNDIDNRFEPNNDDE
jgi:hypothetical protein